MFYAILIFILVILFLFKTRHNSPSARYMSLILAFYMMALIFFALYLSKDTYYYNTANHYFALPKFIWKSLTFFKIDKTTIIRFLNLFVLAVIFLGIHFSCSFLHAKQEHFSLICKRISAVILIGEQILYDPAVIKAVYFFMYPTRMSSKALAFTQELLHQITIFLNLFMIVFSIGILLYTLLKTSGLRMVRLNLLPIFFSYVMIMLSYIYIFFRYPCYLIKVSKLANTITYLPVPLLSSTFLYALFPYFIIITLIIISISIYTGTNLISRLRREDFSISKQIAASDITSRTFCHFLKNELLAIEAELDFLETNETTDAAIQNVIRRCQYLYGRLDVIHRNTHAAKLILYKENLSVIITELLSEYVSASTGIKLHTDLPDCPTVLIDRNYFEQAIMNIIVNAIEAMEKIPIDNRHLYISLRHVDKWVILSIRDTGPGIKPEDISNIFTPFYTSEPIARHWGVGLSLTHKIITAHEGHIEVDSELMIGTTFRIMLPTVQ